MSLSPSRESSQSHSWIPTNHLIVTNRNHDRWTVGDVSIHSHWQTVEQCFNPTAYAPLLVDHNSNLHLPQQLGKSTSKSNPHTPPRTPKTTPIMDSPQVSAELPSSTVVDDSTAVYFIHHPIIAAQSFHLQRRLEQKQTSRHNGPPPRTPKTALDYCQLPF